MGIHYVRILSLAPLGVLGKPVLANFSFRLPPSVVNNFGQGIAVKPPKTLYGRRTTTLAPVTVDVLRTHRRTHQGQWLATGRGKVAPVFATVDGEIMSPHSVSKAWERVTKRLELWLTFTRRATTTLRA